MKYYFTFFPPSVVFFRYLSISKVGHISKHFYLYYYTLLGNITYINFNYLFLMRTILKYVSLLLSIPLFFLHEYYMRISTLKDQNQINLLLSKPIRLPILSVTLDRTHIHLGKRHGSCLRVFSLP